MKKVSIIDIKINKCYGDIRLKYGDMGRAFDEDEYTDEELEESIQCNGMRQPLILNKEMQILDGHRRFLIAKKLEFDTLLCVICDANESQ